MSAILGLLLCLLLGASAFLAASEISLFSLSQPALRSFRASADLRKRLVGHLMDRPRDVLMTLLMLNVTSNVLVQNTVSSIFDQFSDWSLNVGVPLLLTLVFGEVIPKSVALPRNASVAVRAAPAVSVCMRLLTPLRTRLNRLTDFLSRPLFVFFNKEEDVSVEELRHVARSSIQSGVLSAQEARLVDGALDLKESLARDHMRPREEVLFYDLKDPLSELTRLFVEEQCTRVPVCEDNLDRTLGILSAPQFLACQEEIQRAEDLRPILQKPLYVPESMRAFSLLHDLRAAGEEMAMIVDEYGSISGLITQEDLIEVVVGEILDRRDAHHSYTRCSSDVVIASGKLELGVFEDLFGMKLLSKEHVVTLGGWLTEQMGDIPPAGTKYATDDFLFYILAADPNRIRRIYIRRLKADGRERR